MSIRKIALTALAAAAFVAPTLSAANAHHIGNQRHKVVKLLGVHTPGIDRRIANQRQRIRRGIRSGDLTFFEARKLRRGLKRIRRAKRVARYDGRVTRFERRELRAMLNQNSRKIRRLRNNKRTAGKFVRKIYLNTYY